MKLKRIIARNFKGLDFELLFSGQMTILVGDNFAGKSARTDLIRWTILGYIPELGKTNRATFGLSSGREMEGTVEFEDGSRIVRRLTLKGDSVKETVEIPDNLKDEPLLGVMLNAESYFGLTDRERIDYVFKNCPQPAEALGSEQIKARVHNEIDREGKNRDTIEEVFRDAMFAASGDVSFLEELVTAATVEAQRARENAVRMEKTAQGLSGLKAADQTAAVGVIGDPEALVRRMGTLAEEIESIRTDIAGNQTAARRRAEIARELAANADGRAKLDNEKTLLASFLGGQTEEEFHRSLADVNAKLGVARKQLTDAERGDARRRQLEADVAEIPKFEALIAGREEELSAPAPDLAPVRKQLADLNEDGLRVQTSINVQRTYLPTERTDLAKLSQDLCAMVGMTACPYCGATGTGWKVIKQAELESRIADLKKRIGDREKSLQSLLSEAESVKGMITLATAESSRLEAQTEQRRGAERQKALWESTLSVLRAKKDELGSFEVGRPDELKAQIVDLERRKPALERVCSAIALGRNTIAALERSLARADLLQAELGRLPEEFDPVNVVKLNQRFEDRLAEKGKLAVDLDSVRSSMQAAAQRSSDLKRVAEAEAARDRAKLDLEFALKLAELLRTIQAEAVELAFKPMLEIANGLIAGVLKTPLSYHNSEIGTWRGALWVTHRTFSGTERAVAYAAIQAALASKSPIKIVILDELGRIGDRPLGQLLAAISQGIGFGMIDGFVGIDCGRLPFYQKHADSLACQVVEIK